MLTVAVTLVILSETYCRSLLSIAANTNGFEGHGNFSGLTQSVDPSIDVDFRGEFHGSRLSTTEQGLRRRPSCRESERKSL